MCFFVNYQTYKKIKLAIFFFKIAVPIVILGYLAMYAFTPQSYISRKPVLVTIQKGISLKEIAYKLHEKGAVNDPYLFYFIGFISGYSRYMEAGTYFVSVNQSPASIYHEFANGRVATVSVTIPPGFNIFQISQLLVNKRVVGQKRFLKECFDRKFLLSLSIDRRSVEGYLYPDTYDFKINSNPRSVIKEMVDEFKSKINRLESKLNSKKRRKLSYKDLVIASMIIKEANENNRGDMRLISSVIHNRLKINMPLDIDSTSIYGENLLNYSIYIGSADGKEEKNRKDEKDMENKKDYSVNQDYFMALTGMKASYLKLNNPYNTYMNYGITPTPIANPDIKTIKAAMYPDKTDYLYYISTKSGRVVFARTLSGQNRHIALYLK